MIEEKFMIEEKRNFRTEMYSEIYGKENIVHVPLRHEVFREMKIFEKLYISAKSRSSRSHAIVGVWPSPSGILNREPCGDDVRIGLIQYFFVHYPTIKCLSDQQGAQDECTSNQPHVIAEIEWCQDHPRKFIFGNGIIIASTVCEPFSSASFMPISRIISQCVSSKRSC